MSCFACRFMIEQCRRKEMGKIGRSMLLWRIFCTFDATDLPHVHEDFMLT